MKSSYACPSSSLSHVGRKEYFATLPRGPKWTIRKLDIGTGKCCVLVVVPKFPRLGWSRLSEEEIKATSSKKNGGSAKKAVNEEKMNIKMMHCGPNDPRLMCATFVSFVRGGFGLARQSHK